jgi:glucose/arabinose dehydrogenase
MRNKRYIGVSPEERLYVAIGNPDNVGVCGGLPAGNAATSSEAGAEASGATCAIISMDLEGGDIQNYATGVA